MSVVADRQRSATSAGRKSKGEHGAPVEGGSPSESGVDCRNESHTVALSALIRAEREYRQTIVGKVRARLHQGHQRGGPRNASSHAHDPDGLKGSSRSESKIIGQLKTISPEALIAMIPLAEPVNLANGLHEMRQAAHLANLHPERIREARAKLLLGLSEVSSFAYAASSLTHPFGVLAATILTSGVKLLNAAYKIVDFHRASEEKDPMLGGAARIAEMPIMRPALNLLLKAVHHIDTQVTRALDPLKNNFTYSASPRQQRLGDKMLEQYVTLHNQCFPANPVTISSLRENLLTPR